ncbi:MAG TPA: M23 family metallopeptidase [Acidimicrobiia bacterium]|nr:M23 family metallopeptidase [Acidimicrobiia bacterium]
MRKAAAVAIVFLTAVGSTLLIVFPAAADVSSADLDLARDRLRQVNERLHDETARYDQAIADEALLQDRLDGLVVDLAGRERALVLARSAARDRAAEMYMTAGASSPSITATDDVARLPARFVYLAAVSQTDRELVNRLEVSRRDYEQQKALVDQAIVEQQSLRIEMESLVSTIFSELDAANAEYRSVKAQWDAQEAERIRREQEEAARLAFLATSTTTTTTRPTSTTTTTSATTTTTASGTSTTAGITTTSTTTSGTTTTTPDTTTTTASTTTTTLPPQPSGGKTCPVDGATSFSDTWGAPRPGGRAHHGTDLLASEGTPLVAIEGGQVWSPNWDAEGGLGLYLKGDDGDLWYYAHLSSYVPGLVDGLRLEVGQRIGYVGHTGNASVSHLHLGWYPGGYGHPIANPYPVALSLCG